MNSKQGFTLLEVTIFFALLMLISVLAMSGFTALHARVKQQSKRTNRITEVATALDVVVRDLQQMESGLKKQQAAGYVWSGVTADIGWSLEGARIIRTQGKYDPVKNAWHAATKNVALDGVKHFDLVPQYHARGKEKKVVGVELVCTMAEGGSVQRFVAVHTQQGKL